MRAETVSDLGYIVFAGSFALTALCSNLMMWKVSRSVPARQRESSFLSPWKYRRAFRGFFPKSNLLLLHDLCIAGIFIGLVVVIVTLR